VGSITPQLSSVPAPHPPGPVGKQRNIVACLVLFVVTFTFYGLYWVWCVHHEIRRRAATGVGGWLGLVINLIIPFVTLFLVPYEAKQMHEAEGEISPISAWTGLWNLIPLVGTIVWFVKVQRALNEFWAAHTPGVPASGV
jgi:hypothetical protein